MCNATYAIIHLLSETEMNSKLDNWNYFIPAQHSTNAHVPSLQSNTVPSAVRRSFVPYLPIDASKEYLSAEYVRKIPTVIEVQNSIVAANVETMLDIPNGQKESRNDKDNYHGLRDYHVCPFASTKPDLKSCKSIPIISAEISRSIPATPVGKNHRPPTFAPTITTPPLPLQVARNLITKFSTQLY